MAEVYRAEHVHLRRSVALKVPSPDIGADPEYRERFLRESRLAASIQHRNLVTIFDAGEIDGVLFLAMQYVAGGDLRHLLSREGWLAPERAYPYLAQIAAGLDTAHAHGLVHRDVKPANVLLEDGHCYVSDFGLSKLTGGARALTQVGEIVGTLVYAAPEQLNGEEIDARADVYALGCLAFEVLTGALPFNQRSMAALLFAHLHTPPPRPSEIRPQLSSAVDDVFARVLAKAPADRIARAGEFVQELASAFELADRTASSLVRSLSAKTAVAGAPRLPLPRALETAAGAPLAGREGQVSALRAAWAEAEAGTLTLAAIRGEAGIGKTRLAAELAREAHAAGGLVLYGRCDDVLAVPYQPFVEALKPLVDALGVDRVRLEVGGLAGELSRLWPELGIGEPLRSDPESERFVLFEAVATLLQAATRAQPALLVLDDLHWAAAPTVFLLRHLARSEQGRLLIVGTFRDTDMAPDDPLASVLADLYRGNAKPLSVKGIDEAAIAALGVSAEVAAALREQTGGNPFFLREVLRDLTEGSGAPRVSEGLRQVIAQRVARLSEPARRLLNAASVAGATWSFAVLERVLDDPDELLDALEEAERAGLIVEAGADEYTFAHALVRQTLYEGLGSIRARRLHRGIGEALQTLGDPDEHAEDLAHHFALADSAEAAPYALLAGRRAKDRGGYEQSVEHFERGLAAGPGPELRCELLLALADARWATGDVDGVRAAATEAGKLAEQQGDGERLARAALAYGGPLFFSAHGAVLELIE